MVVIAKNGSEAAGPWSNDLAAELVLVHELLHTLLLKSTIKFGTSIKAVLSDHGGIGQPAYRNPACIMPGCTGQGH